MKYCILLVAITTLGACTSIQWITASGSPADKNSLSNALNQCDFEKRRKEALAYLDMLNNTAPPDTAIIATANKNNANLGQYTIECMARKGFKRLAIH